MTEGISWKKELEMAEDVARAGQWDADEGALNRCLSYAQEKANKEGVDISEEVARIRKIWDNPPKKNPYV